MPNLMCEHKKQKHRCQYCSSSSLCCHNVLKFYCIPCKGNGICTHLKRRSRCNACSGASMCSHNRERATCKACPRSVATRLCFHNNRKHLCKICKQKDAFNATVNQPCAFPTQPSATSSTAAALVNSFAPAVTAVDTNAVAAADSPSRLALDSGSANSIDARVFSDLISSPQAPAAPAITSITVSPDFPALVPANASVECPQDALQRWKICYDRMASIPNDIPLQKDLEGHMMSSLPEGLFTVECGLGGDCFYHSIGWLCHVSIGVLKTPAFNFGNVPLGHLHKAMRKLVVSHMLNVAERLKIDNTFFDGCVEGEVTVERENSVLKTFITLMEDAGQIEKPSLLEYIEYQRKQHTFAGIPEICSWVSWSKRPLVMIEQTGDVTNVWTFTYEESSNEILHFVGWAVAANQLKAGAMCILKQTEHYVAVVPAHRLSSSCPKPARYPNYAHAHYTSRSITNRNKTLLIPQICLHQNAVAYSAEM
jgi:hypothetical protein